jgi:hypothetical protein
VKRCWLVAALDELLLILFSNGSPAFLSLRPSFSLADRNVTPLVVQRTVVFSETFANLGMFLNCNEKFRLEGWCGLGREGDLSVDRAKLSGLAD